MPLDWKVRLEHIALFLPHLGLTFLEFSHFIDGSSVFLTKLYFVSLILSVYSWCYISYQLLGNDLKRLRGLLLLFVLGLLPVLVQTTPAEVVRWSALVAEPVAALAGVYVFTRCCFVARTSGLNLPQIALAFVGCLLVGAGVADLLSNWGSSNTEQVMAFTLVASQIAVLRFLFFAYELASRTRALEKNRGQMLVLAAKQHRQLEEARSRLLRYERLRVLNALGASISHEIRNPLATLSANLTLLEKQLPATTLQQPKAVTRMRRNIDRIDSIIQKLLQFARHRHVLEPSSVDLGDWLSAQLTDDQLLQAAGASTLVFDEGKGGSARIEIDVEMVSQALVNLVQNAADANKEAGSSDIIIEMNVRQWEVKVVVMDFGNGLGFEFDPEHIQPLISKKVQGIGMGLMIVSDIAVLHGGSLGLDNREDGPSGAIAVLSLPLPLPEV